MPSNGRNWQVMTWSWACSTGHPASDRILEAAANAAWPYAQLCAWTFMNDDHVAHDLMEHAIKNATQYIARNPDVIAQKVNARVKSEIRREAKRLAAKSHRESPSGSALDFDSVLASHPEIEQHVYANQIFAKLSPFAQGIINRRLLGYTWREIGRDLEMDYSEVRKAYFRELRLLLENLARPGELPKCD